MQRQTADSNLSKEAEPLKEEIRFLTDENQRLQRDFIDLRNDIAHEKEISSKVDIVYNLKSNCNMIQKFILSANISD